MGCYRLSAYTWARIPMHIRFFVFSGFCPPIKNASFCGHIIVNYSTKGGDSRDADGSNHNSLIVAVMGILQMRFAGRNGARSETITSSASIPATDAEGSCHWVPQ